MDNYRVQFEHNIASADCQWDAAMSGTGRNSIRHGGFHMYTMNSDFFDGFAAMFSKDEVIVVGKHFPLGSFTVEFLNFDSGVLRKIDKLASALRETMTIFLSARDAGSAAEAQQILDELWACLLQLPVYKLFAQSSNLHHNLINYLREHPEETDDMIMPGTERNRTYVKWLQRLERFAASIETFARNTDFFAEWYLSDISERTPAAYASAFGRYQRDARNVFEMELTDAKETGSIEPVEHVEIEFPTRISFVSVRDSADESKLILAEKMVFDELSAFLYTDLYRGMITGHIPRKCDNCRRYFLLDSGYDIRYCTKKAPNENGKTCRQVGAHRKEKEKIGSNFVRGEYAKVYNRLKQRKNRGSISVDEWNAAVSQALKLRDKGLRGKIGNAELRRRFGEF